MNVLVAGGTGFIGKKIVETLSSQNYKVFVLTRNINNHKNLFGQNVELVDWNASNPSILSKITVLIKLNGEKVDQLWTKKTKRKILSSRIETTNLLFKFCKTNQIIPKQLINASAVGIYANVSAQYNSAVDEHSNPGNTFLSDVCLQNENGCEIFSFFGNISITQLRIGVVLQKKIVSLLSLPLFFSIPVPGNKNHYFPWVHVDDIAEFTLFSIQNNLDGVFNLTSPDFTTHEEFFKAIIFHKKGLLKWVLFLPKIAVSLLLGDMSEMLLYGPKTKPERTLKSGYKFKFQSLNKAFSNLS
jgi:uncharacterized protein (TIGR01777 family)|tara:strand:+ start:3936 stop:4835 length:900 start_codon:yes stop_codon:yes gene_type:complete